MIDYKFITQKLEQSLYLTSNVLDRSLISDLSSYIYAGEWSIYFEILCENLYEYELPISKETHELLEEISLIIKTKIDYVKLLKPQINPDS